MTFDAARERLPLLGRLGLAWDAHSRATLSVEGEIVRREKARALAGIEWRPHETLALRAGYDGRNETTDGVTAGVGLRLRDFSVDYAYAPLGKLGASHRIGLCHRFGR
jgi:hypothetical protein